MAAAIDYFFSQSHVFEINLSDFYYIYLYPRKCIYCMRPCSALEALTYTLSRFRPS
jgi:hypothetical protein